MRKQKSSNEEKTAVGSYGTSVKLCCGICLGVVNELGSDVIFRTKHAKLAHHPCCVALKPAMEFYYERLQSDPSFDPLFVAGICGPIVKLVENIRESLGKYDNLLAWVEDDLVSLRNVFTHITSAVIQSFAETDRCGICGKTGAEVPFFTSKSSCAHKACFETLKPAMALYDDAFGSNRRYSNTEQNRLMKSIVDKIEDVRVKKGKHANLLKWAEDDMDSLHKDFDALTSIYARAFSQET